MAIQEEADSTPSEPPANAWLPTISPTAASEPKGNQPVENAWLATSKSSKKTSDNRINKIQNKRKRDDEDNAQVHIDVSVAAINQKLAAAAAEAEEDEDAPSMTHGRGKIAFKQTELINRAFAADGFEEEFAAEKQAAIEEDAPKEEDLTLPGWGSWTGQGVKRRSTERKLIKKIPGIEESKRKDAKLKNVIINEKRSKAVRFRFFFDGLFSDYEVSCFWNCAVSFRNERAVRTIVEYAGWTGMDYERNVSKDDKTACHNTCWCSSRSIASTF